MNLKHNYYWFKEALSQEDCKKIIDLGLSKIEEEKSKGNSTVAVTAGNTHKGGSDSLIMPMGDKTLEEISKEEHIPLDQIEKQKYIRDSEVAWLNEKWLYELIMPHVKTANKQAGWNFDFTNCEPFQFTVYKPGGFYGWHVDSGSDHYSKYKRYIPGVSPTNKDGSLLKDYKHDVNLIGKVRKLSVTVNLNLPGEYEGGNLKFDFGPHALSNRYHECEEIRPQGSIIVFPSFVYHQVTPIVSGTRYSLVLWCLGHPFK
jgi:PKHD-type hydroxylase